MTVKLTDAQLKQIIREEVEASIDEGVMDALKSPFKTAVSTAGKMGRAGKAAAAGLSAAGKSWRGDDEEEESGGNEKENLASKLLNQLVAKCQGGDQEACVKLQKFGELQKDKAAAAGEAPAAAAATKNNVYIFKGKGGKGVQSQMARVGIKGQDMSRLMKGLKVDLTTAGFNVMQEAGRRQIALTNTLAALEQIVDPAQKEAVKKILIQVLRSNQVKVHPQHSRALAPSIEDPTPEDTEAAAATKAPDKGEMFNYVSGKGAKAVVVVTDPLERAPEAAQVSKVNPETCKASTSRVFAAPVSKLADPVDRCVPKQGAPKKGQTFNYVSGKGNKSTVVVVDALKGDPKSVQVAKVNPETCKAASKRVFAVSTAKLTDRAAKCVPKPKQPKAAPEEDRNSWVPKAPGIKEGAGDMKALMENWNKFLE